MNPQADPRLSLRLWFDRDDGDDGRSRVAAGVPPAAWPAAVDGLVGQGFTVLRQAVPAPLLRRCWTELEQALREHAPLWCHREGVGVFRSDEAVAQGVEIADAAVHDFHNRSPAALQVATHAGFVPLLAALLDATPVLMQSQLLGRASGKGVHADYVYYPIAAPLRTLTVWIAAEAVDARNGPLLLYPGSHRLPLWRFDGGHWLWPHGEDRREIERHCRLWAQRCRDAGLVGRAFTAQAGDLVVMHPRLAHAAAPALEPGLTRRSIVLHFAAADAYGADHRPLPAGSRLVEVGGVRFFQPHGA